MTTEHRLPCGCILGHHLCGEAQALWSEVNRCYVHFWNYQGTWEEYLEARAAYDAHFDSMQEPTGRIVGGENV